MIESLFYELDHKTIDLDSDLTLWDLRIKDLRVISSKIFTPDLGPGHPPPAPRGVRAGPGRA